MVDKDAVKRRFESLLPAVDERMRRLIAAAESLAIDYGGISIVGEPRGDCEFDFSHHHPHWFKGASSARHQLLSGRSQSVKKTDCRDKYSSRLVPRRMELYNSSE